MNSCEIFATDDAIKYFFTSVRYADVECPLHLHPNMEIILVTEGTLHMEIDSCCYDIPQGHATFVPPFAPHLFHSETHNNCHVLMFLKELVPCFADFLDKNTPANHLFRYSPECFSLVERILPLAENHADILPAQAVLSPLIYEIYTTCAFYTSPRKGADFLTEALVYMDRHFTEPITLTGVARAVGVHPVTLSKGFSQLQETNFNSHLNYLRCSHAAMLIQNRHLSFTEAAFASGFGCVRSFNRAFRQVYGVTPTQFQALPVEYPGFTQSGRPLLVPSDV